MRRLILNRGEEGRVIVVDSMNAELIRPGPVWIGWLVFRWINFDFI
jgi:hypothetical protein